ncbi:MAG: hypothetical protein ABI954_10150 [Pyrinomonadaceae bacterium]
MRKILLGIIGLMFFALPASAQTADEIIAKYVAKIGGMDKIQAIKTMRQTGKLTGGGGFEAVIVSENKRPNKSRQEFSLQGLTAVSAYDGADGWRINPFQGKKDAESLGEDEMKALIDETEFDDSLINYQQRGSKVEYVGMDTVDGTDVYKLKATLKSGTVKTYFMDTDYFVPIKIETKRTIRGAEQESETILGDYKEVAGVYFPHSFESGAKGSQNKSKVTIEKIETNIPVDDNRFMRPTIKTAAQPTKTPEDMNVPKTKDKKTETPSGAKPPVQK